MEKPSSRGGQSVALKLVLCSVGAPARESTENEDVRIEQERHCKIAVEGACTRRERWKDRKTRDSCRGDHTRRERDGKLEKKSEEDPVDGRLESRYSTWRRRQ